MSSSMVCCHHGKIVEWQDQGEDTVGKAGRTTITGLSQSANTAIWRSSRRNIPIDPNSMERSMISLHRSVVYASQNKSMEAGATRWLPVVDSHKIEGIKVS